MLVMIVLLGWGFWGFFGKLASEKIGHQVLLWSGISSFVVLLIYLWWTNQLSPIKSDMNAISLAILSGITIMIGSFSYYTLLKQDDAGKIVTLAALYPVVTLILSVIFLFSSFWNSGIFIFFSI